MEAVKPKGHSIYKVILVLGFTIPLLLAAVAANLVSAEIVITLFVVFTVYMLSFFSYWIIMKAIFQLIEKSKKAE